MKVKLKYLLILLVVFVFSGISVENVFASEIVNTKDIEIRSYVIGKHLFTYEGTEELTLELIMLASKTIDSSDIEDMIIYYKNPRGIWINSSTGLPIENVPETMEIEYAEQEVYRPNLKYELSPLEHTVYDAKYKTFMVNLEIDLSDFISRTNYKVENGKKYYDITIDGLEIREHHYGTGYDFVSDIGLKDSLYIENNNWDYHETVNVGVNDQQYYYVIKPYVFNKQGNKEYLMEKTIFNGDGDSLWSAPKPVLTVKNSIKNTDGKSLYTIGLKDYDITILNGNSNELVYYRVSSFSPELKLNEIGDYYILQNGIGHYTARVCIRGADNGHDLCIGESEELVIDPRTLTAPTWDGEAKYNSSFKKEYIGIDYGFYSVQDKKSLDYKVSGFEIYEIDLNGEYKQVTDTNYFEFVKPQDGYSYYVARAYATNEEGKKVFSELSDKIHVVTTPELQISSGTEGKTIISVSNSSDYAHAHFYYEVYTFDINEGETLLAEAFTIDESIEIEVEPGTEIYAKAVISRNQTETYYSDSSVKYTIE